MRGAGGRAARRSARRGRALLDARGVVPVHCAPRPPPAPIVLGASDDWMLSGARGPATAVLRLVSVCTCAEAVYARRAARPGRKKEMRLASFALATSVLTLSHKHRALTAAEQFPGRSARWIRGKKEMRRNVLQLQAPEVTKRPRNRWPNQKYLKALSFPTRDARATQRQRSSTAAQLQLQPK